MEQQTLTGKFERLTVLPQKAIRPFHVVCQCDCGKVIEVTKSNVKLGNTKSCGCLNRERKIERLRNRKPRHGHTSRTNGASRTYCSWQSMQRRCLDVKFRYYPIYGGRGITICKRWDKFDNFLADMGVRPEGMTLDRIDSNGNYELSNCRWADNKTQLNNTARNRRVEFCGVSKTIAQWADEIGMNYNSLWKQLFRKNYDLSRITKAVEWSQRLAA